MLASQPRPISWRPPSRRRWPIPSTSTSRRCARPWPATARPAKAELDRGPVLRQGHIDDLAVMPFRRRGQQLLVLLRHLVGLRIVRVGAIAGLILERNRQPDLVGIRLA